MRLMSAIFTLLAGLLLVGLAYAGYVENARVTTVQIGSYEDRFAPRADKGMSIEQAEEQGRLAIAGMEAVAGFMLMGAAVYLCGPADPKPVQSEYDLPRKTALVAPPQTGAREKGNGRERIEELRQRRTGGREKVG